jgi:hypothetical protein
MNEDLLAIAAAAGIVLAGITVMTALLKRRRKKPLNVEDFTAKWQAAQKLCSAKETWPLAIINADKLLDEALKKQHYKGKSMGERLASAQRDLSDNDAVWFGHKLRNKLVHEHDVTLDKEDVQDALAGIRQALRDLGALRK